MKLIFIALSLVLTITYCLSAQDPLLRHFTLKDGLPGGNVYMSMQDSKGYIWSATERGVTKFDGHQFKLFSIENGLPCNDVWKIQEDEKGRIWVSTFNHVCYIEEDQIKIMDDVFDLKPTGKVQHFFGALGHIVLFTETQNVFLLNDSNRILIHSKFEGFDFNVHGLRFEEERVPDLFSLYKKKKGWNTDKRLSLINKTILINESQEVKGFFTGKKYKACGTFLTVTKNKILFLFLGNLILIDHGQVIPIDMRQIFGDQLGESILAIDKVSENRIWIKTPQSHIILDTLFRPILNLSFLSKYSVSNVIFDKQENLWASSSHGLFFLNKGGQKSITYSLKGDLKMESIKDLSFDKQKKIWGLSTAGNLYTLEEDIGLKAMSANPLVQVPADLEFDAQGDLLVGGNQILKINQERLNEGIPINKVDEDIGVSPLSISFVSKNIHVSLKGKTLVATHSCIFELDSLGSKIKVNKNSGRFYSLAAKKNGDYWAAGKNGLELFSKDGEVFDNWKLKDTFLFNSPIDNIVLDEEDILWMAVNNEGLFRYDGTHLNSIKELNRVLVASLYFDEKKQLWVSTNQGLVKIYKITTNPFSYKVSWFTEVDGLASDNVYEVLINNGKIYAATENGMSILPNIEKDTANVYAPFRFSNLKIKDVPTKLQKSYNLRYYENKIEIAYECLDYKNTGAIFFQYKLEGLDLDWTETNALNKEYSSLPPGEYTFRIRRRPNQLVANNSEELKMTFIVNAPFWKRNWFILAGLALLSLIVFFIIKKQTNKIRKEVEEENRVKLKFVEMELSALQAQLNPHFVSNALQAIQDLIFQKEERIANRYLVKFSRLMRLILESSKEKVIALQDELKLVKLYVELEQLRFKDQFFFDIHICEELEFSMIEIPTMLLQPFVENAINHGLNHRKTPGTLLIAFTQEAEKLYCRIEDNGIGREKTKELKRSSIKSYKSRGIQLVEERKNAWNSLGNAPINILIEDLYDNNQKACGTRVTLVVGIEI